MDFFKDDGIVIPLLDWLDSMDICHLRLASAEFAQYPRPYISIHVTSVNKIPDLYKSVKRIRMTNINMSMDEIMEWMEEYGQFVEDMVFEKMDHLRDRDIVRFGQGYGDRIRGLELWDCYCLTSELCDQLGVLFPSLCKLRINGISMKEDEWNNLVQNQNWDLKWLCVLGNKQNMVYRFNWDLECFEIDAPFAYQIDHLNLASVRSLVMIDDHKVMRRGHMIGFPNMNFNMPNLESLTMKGINLIPQENWPVKNLITDAPTDAIDHFHDLIELEYSGRVREGDIDLWSRAFPDLKRVKLNGSERIHHVDLVKAIPGLVIEYVDDCMKVNLEPRKALVIDDMMEDDYVPPMYHADEWEAIGEFSGVPDFSQDKYMVMAMYGWPSLMACLLQFGVFYPNVYLVLQMGLLFWLGWNTYLNPDKNNIMWQVLSMHGLAIVTGELWATCVCMVMAGVTVYHVEDKNKLFVLPRKPVDPFEEVMADVD